LVKEKTNPTVMRQNRTKMGPIAVTPTTEKPKGRGRQKAMILEETCVRRSPRMRGKISKESTSSKPSTEESPVQIEANHSPPHPKITNIPKNPNEECRFEVNKNQNDTSIGQLGTSSYRDETILEQVYPNTTLVPYKSTWLIEFLEHLWREQRKRKRNHEEDSSSIILQKLLFQLFGQHMFVAALWEEERKIIKKDIVSLSAEIIDLKEQLANKKQRMDHALKLADQALAYRPPPWIYSLCLKE